MQIGRIGKYYYRRLQRLKGDPYALAGGFAIGVFIGCTPTIPFHTVAIIVATLASRTSTVAGILSSWVVCNPFTYLPIYYLSLVIGNAATPYHLNWEKIKSLLELLLTSDSIMHSIDVIMGLGYEAIVIMLVGGVILAIPCTILSFYLSLKFFIAVKQKRAQKQILN